MRYKIKFPAGYSVADIADDNLDVNIITEQGVVYFACLYTVANVAMMMKDEFNKYFWTPGLVIVPDLTKFTIATAIEQMIEDGNLSSVCEEIGNVEDIYEMSFDELMLWEEL